MDIVKNANRIGNFSILDFCFFPESGKFLEQLFCYLYNGKSIFFYKTVYLQISIFVRSDK